MAYFHNILFVCLSEKLNFNAMLDSGDNVCNLYSHGNLLLAEIFYYPQIIMPNFNSQTIRS